MKLIVTAYKETGKFYDQTIIETDTVPPLYETKALIRLFEGKIPFLQSGFLHVRLSDEDSRKPDAPFCDHLFRVTKQRTIL